MGSQGPWRAIKVGLRVVKTLVTTTDSYEVREYSP